MSVINTNVKSLVARDAMTINNRSLSTAMERLSTGKRINSAADDAAGLAIGTRMDAQVKGLNMAIKNANDTISVTQTAEGAMQEITSILQRMRELSVQSASDTNSAEDRAFLQQEVSQLSTEIDRISSTTQFNGMNVLDGSWANKTFQIGANQGQTMKFSIGNMKSSMLGVASSQVGGSSAPSTAGITGVGAQGAAATATTIKLSFDKNASYAFTLADSVTGLSGSLTATALDLGSEMSKADFAKAVNKALKESAVNTSVTGSAATATVDITTKPESVKFSVSIGGVTKDIDLFNRLNNAAVSKTAVTNAEVRTAMEAELQAQFDNSITVTTSANKLTVTDAQGRAVEVGQGVGDGSLFGTDAANVGTLYNASSTQNTMSVAWSGNDLMLTNKSGGETTISGYAATVDTTATVKFQAVNATAGQRDPIVLTGAASSDAMVAANGSVEDSKLSVAFSNVKSTGTYAFKLTDGAGHTYANLTALNVKDDQSSSTIVAAVRTALATGLGSLDDKSIDVSDFDIQFQNNTLTVTSKEGRALALEGFSSTIGSVAVTPMNELGKTTTLASQSAFTSEVRMGVNSSGLGVDYSGQTSAGNFDVYVDGIKSNISIDLQTVLTAANTASGSTIATQLQTKLTAITATSTTTKVLVPGSTTLQQDLSNVTVTFDSTTNELVINDSKGRAIGLTAASADPLRGSGILFVNDSVQGQSNRVPEIKTSSGIAQGGLYQTTTMKMTLSEDVSAFDFQVNGVWLNSGLSSGNSTGTVSYDANAAFAGSDLKTKLDALVTKLNGSHPNAAYEYSVNGRDITFSNREGGSLEIEKFTAGSNDTALTATLTPGAGQGNAAVVGYNEVVATAKATGVAAIATTATLNLQGDDLVSFSVSDGANTYNVASQAIDISNSTSASNFVKEVNKALVGSNIHASMDTNGNVFFNDNTGGSIQLTAYNAASGRTANWTPGAGQGDASAVSSGYVGSGTAGSGAVAVGGGSSSVAQLTIATQAGATAAIATIDKALSYVNAERSKLGAIENRLTHTVDNLTNIVTNTAASKSRIVDTDYANETTELARAQIISQAATAMLAQANQSAQGVLSLLK